MRFSLSSAKQTDAGHSSVLLLTGLGAVGAYNWYLWQRDRALADGLRAQHPALPVLNYTPKVSVLVAAWNEAAYIDAHIQSFLALTYPDIELILCAGGVDGTLMRARRYACERVVVLEQKSGEGKQSALARALEQARGDIIYLTDADCLYEDEALIRILAPLVNNGDQAATGSSRPLSNQATKILPTYLWAVDTVSNAHRPQYIHGLLGRNAAVTRKVLDQIGGLSFPARIGTDYQLAKRLLTMGVAVRFIRTSTVPSKYPETLGIYRQKQSRWLRNLVIYGLYYKAKEDVLVTLKTIITGVVMLIMPIIAYLLSPMIITIWILLFIHGIFSKCRYIFFTARLYARSPPLQLILVLAPLTLIDFAVWALPVFDLINPRMRKRW